MSTRPAELTTEPNVTPMIDVLLVLLIIFMMMVSARQAITAQLPPPADGRSQPRATAPLVLTVSAGPRYAINQQPVAPGTLGATLTSLFAARREKVLFIAGERGATYQDVIGAMDAARGAGVRVLGLAPGTTRPGPARRE